MIDKRKLKSEPIKMLTDLVIEEVSLVDRPANPGAEVLVFKRLDLDASVLNSCSVEKLTAAMESIDYAKIGTTPEELWSDFVNEVMENHNVELIQRQKHPPDKLTDEEVKELRQKKPWTEEQAAAVARRSNVGQGLWQLVQNCVREREAALLEKLDKMDEDLEGMKAMSQNTIEIYDNMKTERMKMGTIVEKILSKAFESQGEAVNSLKLDLTNQASADDQRMPEKRLDDFLLDNPNVETAIRELPNVAKVEVQEKRDFGPTYAKISKKVDELMSKGTVSSRAKGFVKVMDSEPELLVQYYKEQL